MRKEHGVLCECQNPETSLLKASGIEEIQGAQKRFFAKFGSCGDDFLCRPVRVPKEQNVGTAFDARRNQAPASALDAEKVTV